MMHRRRFLAFAAALSATGVVGCGKKSDGGDSSRELRIGMDLTSPPFEMLDASGSPDGASVKIAEALAEHLGRPLKIVPMQFSGLISALKTGNIDLILSSMTASDERRKSIDFSEPYVFTGLALLVRKDSSIQSIEDLKREGKAVSAKAGTTGELWASANLPGLKQVVFEDQAACVLEVTQGRSDAFLYDQLSIYKYAKQNADTTRGLLKAFTEEPWAIGVRKGNDALRVEVNAFIQDFRAKGGFEKIADQYMSEEKKALEAQGIPFMLR